MAEKIYKVQISTAEGDDSIVTRSLTDAKAYVRRQGDGATATITIHAEGELVATFDGETWEYFE